MAILTRAQFYYLVGENFSLYYYTVLKFEGIVTPSIAIEITDFFEKKQADKSLINLDFDEYLYKLKKYIHRLKILAILQV